LITSLFVKSQTILSDSVTGVNCYHDGSISLSISNVNTLSLNWFYEDDDLGWISADTMSSVQFVNSDLDSLITTQCGSYKVEFNSVVKYFWVSCPLGFSASHKNVKCYGDSTGRLKRVGHSGSPPYYYEWFMNGSPYSSGYNDTLFDDLVVGLYKVIITDSVGCSDSVTANIVSPSLLNIDTIYSNDINCRGANTGNVSCSVSGGKRYIASEFYNYYLIEGIDTIAKSDTNGSSPSFSSVLSPYQITFDSLFAGEYIISIVDSFGCSINDTFNVVEPLPYQTFASTTFPLICESDSGYLHIDSVLGGGNIVYGFIGPNTDSIYVPSGFYDMYIEDLDFGCIDTVPVRCYAQFEILVYESIIDVICHGENTGAIYLDSIVGGNVPYDVQWGGINNTTLFANTYEVIIVDSIGCVHSEEYIVNEPEEIDPNEMLYSPSCNGMLDGSIAIDLTGGTGSLTYYWLNGTGLVDSLYGISAGIYTLVVTDAFMCVDTIDIVLSEAEELTISFENYLTPLLCNGSLTNVNAVINGGTGPFNSLWNDGNTNNQRIIGVGTYTCSITDANGCSVSDVLVITEPDSLELNLSYSEISCDNGAVATVNLSGGVPPLSVLWSTGDTTMSVDSLWGTVYWVMITDSCGNTISDTFELHPYVLATSLYYDDSTHIGEVEIDTSSSVGLFTYQWTDILGNIISVNSVSSALCEGTYFVTTTDVTTDCSVIDTLEASFYLPNGIVDISTTTVFPDSNLWGNPPYTYLWDNGEVLAHANLCSGSHWVEVTDSMGCLVREDFNIDPLLITLDPANSIIECNLENLDIDITADATGGIAPYTY